MPHLTAHNGHARIVTGINVETVIALVRAMDAPPSEDPWAPQPADYCRRLHQLLAEIPAPDLRGLARQADTLADRLEQQAREDRLVAARSSRFD